MNEEKQLNKELLLKMINCVKREVQFRHIVYKKRVANGTMKPEEAEEEKRLMYLVQLTLQKIYDGNVPQTVQQALFDTAVYKPKNTSYLDPR